ncbi:hypothetical protein DNTS_020302 [Danionella cerebrum]|uniref:THAP domain-containing protein 1 n=1 Tax=Danionella cerebrum TaxID=2873325 RepID=A0A553RD61_9TELE|nr:hypothetical protein DNTS_020302 [Danionella translucida]
MVQRCCAYNCQNIVGTNNLSFHGFPLKDINLLKKWLKHLRWKGWKPNQSSKICSEHFEKKCFIEGSEGQKAKLQSWAVPTIFSFPKLNGIVGVSSTTLQVESTAATPVQPNSQEPGLRSPEMSLLVNTTDNRLNRADADSSSTQHQSELGTVRWSILGDEGLHRSITIPSFFHSGYCFPNYIRWAGDDELNIKPHVAYGVLGQTQPHIIEVKERWQWLGLDVRGPFSPTVNQHTHIMTLMDYHSKWVEAFPVTHNLSQDVAQCLAEVIRQQGFPLAVLSRLPRKTLLEINRELKKQLTLSTNALVVHHRQTGYMDLKTESLLNDALDKLVKEHSDIWDIHLPAAMLRLCCTDHPTTNEKPFTRMCATDPPFSSEPREMPCNRDSLEFFCHPKLRKLIIQLLQKLRMMADIHLWQEDPERFMKTRSLNSTASRNVFVLVVEGFLIFNHRPLNDLFSKRYFLQIPYEACRERRSSRVYVPPDPPGYFDGYVWPMYLKNRKVMEETLQEMVFLDGTQKQELLVSSVLTDIQEMLLGSALSAGALMEKTMSSISGTLQLLLVTLCLCRFVACSDFINLPVVVWDVGRRDQFEMSPITDLIQMKGGNFSIKCSVPDKSTGFYLETRRQAFREVLYYHFKSQKLTIHPDYKDRISEKIDITTVTVEVSNLQTTDTGAYWCRFTDSDFTCSQKVPGIFLQVHGGTNDLLIPLMVMSVGSVFILLVLLVVWILPKVKSMFRGAGAGEDDQKSNHGVYEVMTVSRRKEYT